MRGMGSVLFIAGALGCGTKGPVLESHGSSGGAGALANIGGASSVGGSTARGGSSSNSLTTGLAVNAQSTLCTSTCSELNANCGRVTDTHCGGVIDCGACPADEICGAIRPNRCGKPEIACEVKSCQDLAANCGAVSDGCGGLLDCGTCPWGQVCGAVTANRCDAGTNCESKTCGELGFRCGMQGDNCGKQLDCGNCPDGERCIASGRESHCSRDLCQRKSCEELGAECGVVSDGCSGTQYCGNHCQSPKICGGGDQPGKCGCKGMCSQIPNCPSGETTSIRGKVYDPAGLHPLPNALVYIPNNPTDPDLKPFPTRTASCDVCGATAAGDPLVSTQTAIDGSFTLSNVPVGDSVALVIQLGRWRRIFEVKIAAACKDNPLPNGGKLTLPRNKAEGDIPRIAVVTGRLDAMECLLWKTGVDTTEFTNPTGSGRVHLYTGSGTDGDGINDGRGAFIDRNTPSELTLFAKDATGNIPLKNYDVLVLSCQGTDYAEHATLQDDFAGYMPSLAYWKDLVDYANAGGRIFATHFSYTYLRAGDTANPFRGTANWGIYEDTYPPLLSHEVPVVVAPERNSKGQGFADWLGLPEVSGLASNNPPKVHFEELVRDVRSVNAPSRAWTETRLASNSATPASVLQYDFNTPVGKDVACGRVVFSDPHISPNSGDVTRAFPQNCSERTSFEVTEKVLEYMLFDLSACVTPYVPVCRPRTCSELGISCGMAGDGCGKVVDCGSCPNNQICGLLTPGQCGSYSCTPRTCTSQGLECGAAGDGCGGALDCGTCPNGQICGAAGPGQCGSASCTPQSCADQGLECGLAGDGCGSRIDCGTCSSPAICGANGPGQCGTPACKPMTCSTQGIECGAAGDGCGAEIFCGNCSTGMICGLNSPGKCGKPSVLL